MAGQLSHLSVHIHSGNNQTYTKAAAEYVMTEH